MQRPDLRRLATIILSVTALAVPSASVWAASSRAAVTAKKKVTIATKSFTGSPGSADRYGEVQVTVVVRKTTTTIGTHKTVKRHFVTMKIPVYPDHTDRSVYISQQALPYLMQEALQAQSANGNMVSGATFTSQGFIGSLQDAIRQAQKW